jgi:hypothetical protein
VKIVSLKVNYVVHFWNEWKIHYLKENKKNTNAFIIISINFAAFWFFLNKKTFVFVMLCFDSVQWFLSINIQHLDFDISSMINTKC